MYMMGKIITILWGPVRGGGGGTHVPCLTFSSSYVSISQGSYVACRNFFLEELSQGIRPCEIEKKSHRYNSGMNVTDEVKFLQQMTNRWNMHMCNWILIFVN